MRNETTSSSMSALQADALETRFALRLTAGLSERSSQLAPDITERLRHAREQAMARARASAPRLAAAPAVSGNGGATLSLRGFRLDASPWWGKLAVLLPLVALVGGLVFIQHWHTQNQVTAAAEIDVSLLADDLPPDAYSDPGFLEFLKTPRD